LSLLSDDEEDEENIEPRGSKSDKETIDPEKLSDAAVIQAVDTVSNAGSDSGNDSGNDSDERDSPMSTSKATVSEALERMKQHSHEIFGSVMDSSEEDQADEEPANPIKTRRGGQAAAAKAIAKAAIPAANPAKSAAKSAAKKSTKKSSNPSKSAAKGNSAPARVSQPRSNNKKSKNVQQPIDEMDDDEILEDGMDLEIEQQQHHHQPDSDSDSQNDTSDEDDGDASSEMYSDGLGSPGANQPTA
jgi:hypothetical protein